MFLGWMLFFSDNFQKQLNRSFLSWKCNSICVYSEITRHCARVLLLLGFSSYENRYPVHEDNIIITWRYIFLSGWKTCAHGFSDFNRTPRRRDNWVKMLKEYFSSFYYVFFLLQVKHKDWPIKNRKKLRQKSKTLF